MQEVRSEEVVDVSGCESMRCIRGIYINYRGGVLGGGWSGVEGVWCG